MASEATGRAVEFLVPAFAVGLGLWMLCQIPFTRTLDWISGDGGSRDDDVDTGSHGGGDSSASH